MNTFRCLLSEVLGTFWICFVSIGAILSVSSPFKSGIGLLGEALAYGFAWAVAVSVLGGISKAHLNPAITLAMVAAKGVKLKRGAMYVISQLLGATLAALVCNVVFPEEAVRTRLLGIPLPPETEPLPAWISVQIILAVEFVLTFFLVMAYFGTVVDDRGRDLKIGGWAVGLVATIGVLVAGPISGASMNPARSFGPAAVFLHWDLHWCYWVAPLAAGLIVGLLYRFLLLEQDIEIVSDDEEEG